MTEKMCKKLKIAHVGIAGPFTENMSYQDNCLSHQNAVDGHDVLYIANSYAYLNGILTNVGYHDKVLEDGVRLIRLPYTHLGSEFTSCKIRRVKGIYQILSDFQPDVILSHDLCYWSLLDVIRYKKDNPEVKLYADTHTAGENSGTNWLSLHVLHRGLYRWLTHKALPYLEKYWYIGYGEKLFSIEQYGVPEEMMEYYPLGGNIFSEQAYAEKRQRRRAELGMAPDELLLIHTGKMGPLKRTADLLRAFHAVPQLNARLVLIGSIPDDVEPIVKPLIEQDHRVTFLGWKKAEELLEYLCAADLYCQPGSGSATMQNALCCGCPVAAYPRESYVKLLDYGQFYWIKTQEDMEMVFAHLADAPEELSTMEQNAWKCAKELLDYQSLARRLYESS